MKQRWKKYLLYAPVVLVAGILFFVLEETVRLKNTGFETKTLWDWMELLIIPLVLAIGAFYLQRSERAVERKIAEDRAKLESEIATDRQQEAALQAYLDRMAELLLKERLQEPENVEAQKVARIRTLTVMRRLNAIRNGIVLRFLKDIEFTINLFAQANLQGADLEGVEMEHLNLQNANLRGANLDGAFLTGTHLYGANLQDANLHGANLQGANLSSANLMSANLKGANLQGANLFNANLLVAKLQGTDLSNAKLNFANLQGAILQAARTCYEL